MWTEMTTVPYRDGFLNVAITTPQKDLYTGNWVACVHGNPGGDMRGPDNIFSLLACHLAPSGIGCIRFDFWGCGKSGGKPVDMTLTGQVEQLDAVLSDALPPNAKSVGVVAESLGSVPLLLRWPQRVQGAAVFLWPAVNLPDTSLRAYITADIPLGTDKLNFDVPVGEEFVREIHEVGDLTDRFAGIEVPTLIIFGDHDTDCLPKDTQAAFWKLDVSDSALIKIPGGEHGLVLPSQQDRVCYETTRWMVNHLVTAL